MSRNTCADSCSTALTYAKGKGPSYESIANAIEDCRPPWRIVRFYRAKKVKRRKDALDFVQVLKGKYSDILEVGEEPVAPLP